MNPLKRLFPWLFLKEDAKGLLLNYIESVKKYRDNFELDPASIYIYSDTETFKNKKWYKGQARCFWKNADFISERNRFGTYIEFFISPQGDTTYFEVCNDRFIDMGLDLINGYKKEEKKPF